jgi:hypothetical protein
MLVSSRGSRGTLFVPRQPQCERMTAIDIPGPLSGLFKEPFLGKINHLFSVLRDWYPSFAKTVLILRDSSKILNVVYRPGYETNEKHLLHFQF